MDVKGIFRPKPTISDQELAKGLRWLTWEGVVSMNYRSITSRRHYNNNMTNTADA